MNYFIQLLVQIVFIVLNIQLIYIIVIERIV